MKEHEVEEGCVHISLPGNSNLLPIPVDAPEPVVAFVCGSESSIQSTLPFICLMFC
jgi:hypothetical protein